GPADLHLFSSNHSAFCTIRALGVSGCIQGWSRCVVSAGSCSTLPSRGHSLEIGELHPQHRHDILPFRIADVIAAALHTAEGKDEQHETGRALAAPETG